MAGQMKVEIRQISGTTSEARMGKHRVLIDRSFAKGGTDEGPMGGELFLASVGGCFISNLLAAIRARDAQVTDVQVEVTGTLAEAPVRYAAIELSVSADCEDRELMEKLVEIAERGCIMVSTLAAANIDLRVRVATPV